MPDFKDGTPIWVDVSTRDLDASRAFYSQLFGWEAEVQPDAGGYTLFTKDGKMTAGLGPIFNPDQPPAWAMYIQTSDAGATTQAVKEAGGQVVVEPMDVMGQGTMAVFVDAGGAHVCAWQPGQHRGAELVNETGSFVWSELYTRDIPADKSFYEKVFGWTAQDSDMGNGAQYTTFSVDGRGIAGGMDMSFLPDDVPPHWLVYFTVDNVDAAVSKIEELGGKSMNPAMDIDIGRFAVVGDPQGAVFAVYEVKAQQ